MLRQCLALAGLAVGLLSACVLVEYPLSVGPMGAVPNLLGIWEGTWGEIPLTLAITDQDDTRVAGVLTYGLRDGPISTNAQGKLGSRAGTLALRLTVESTWRYDQFEFSTVAPDRLQGRGATGGGLFPGEAPVVVLRRRT
jgi:hypothetical protein